MDYNNYVHADQFLAQQSQDQNQDQYVVIHSGGAGLAHDGFVIPTTSDDLIGNLVPGEQGNLSHLNVLPYYEEGKEEEKKKEEEDDDDDHEDVDDILRNVMRVQGIQSLSPTPSEGESPPRMTQRRPLTERQSHNAIATSTLKELNPRPPIHAHLPQGFSYKFAGKGSDCIAGVITRRVIDKGQWFGPYNGSLLIEEAGQFIGSTWELCLRGAVCFYLDGRNKIHNNWLYHINSARTREEQNLEALQHYGDIYFRALDTIQPGTELKVFYSDEYREKIGCKMKLAHLNYQKDTDDFQCMECKNRYKTSKSMLRHIKFTHDREGGPSSPKLPEDTTSSHPVVGNSSASDQLAQLARCVREESMSDKGVFERSSERNAFQNGSIKEDNIVCKVERLSKNAVSHGNVHHSGNTFRPETLLKRTKNSTCKQAAVAKNNIVLPRRIATAARGGDHVCPTCGKSFINEGILASHQLFHRTTITEFKCEVCGLVSKTFQEFIRHRNGHAERLHNCFLCENKYLYVSSYTRHLRNAHHVHKLRGKYTCRLCKLSVHGKMNMFAHRAVCTPERRDEKEWRREEAEAERRSNALKSHQQDSSDRRSIAFAAEESNNCESAHHLEDEAYGGWISEEEDPGSDKEEVDMDSVDSINSSWNQDNNGASTSDSQQRKPGYIVSYAQEESDRLGRRFGYYDRPRPFQCKRKSCRKSYTSHKELMSHIRRVHRLQKRALLFDSRPYKCEQCPRTFCTLQAWNNHKVDHTGVKPFKCEPCFKWFRTSRRLQVHKDRIHKEHDKKYECAICGKKFLKPYALRNHERRHRGERNFACEICQRTFTTKDSLRNHTMKHADEKPFACEICGKRFSLNIYLVRHASTHRFEKAKELMDEK